MAFKMEFSTGNAAFGDEDNYEVARILRKVADQVILGETEGIARDINGNTVGEWSLTEDK